MIAWAKAKRERLRGAHLAPDYIPTAAAPPGLSRCEGLGRACGWAWVGWTCCNWQCLQGDSRGKGLAAAALCRMGRP